MYHSNTQGSARRLWNSQSQLGRLTLLISILLGWGCADSTAPVVMGEMAGMMAGSEVPLGGTTIPPGARLTLQGDPNQQTLVDVGGMLELRLRYVMNEVTPVTGRPVSFELQNQAQMPSPTGVDGTTLSAARMSTNERGEASVIVYAGQVSTSVIVRAYDQTDPQVASLSWRVTVARSGEGGLEVTVRYDPQDPRSRYTFNQFSSARVTLFNNVNCAQIQSIAPNFVGAYESLPEILPFNDLDNKVNSSALPMGINLSIAALIYNPVGAPVAFGCVEGITTQERQVIPVQVMTNDLPLSYKGVYTAVHRFDLIQALQDSEQLGTLGDVFHFLRILGGSNEELGAGIIDTICDIADLPDIACDLVEGVAGGTVGRIINDTLPPQIRSVLRVVGETLDIVGDLTIIGELEFSQNVNPDGFLLGNDNRWGRLRFGWDVDCPTPGSCNREITFAQLGRHNRTVAGLFDAQEQEDGRVAILEHNFAIAYGSIILGLLESFIIPLAYGDNSGNPITLEDFLRINLSDACDSINMSIGLAADSTICIDTLALAVSALVRDQVGRLNFEEDALVMSGSFIPRDTDNNLTVDKLDNGIWSGVINGGLSFDGCFTACRGQECDGPVCEIMP